MEKENINLDFIYAVRDMFKDNIITMFDSPPDRDKIELVDATMVEKIMELRK